MAAVKRPAIRKSMVRQSMLLTTDQLEDMKSVFHTVGKLRLIFFRRVFVPFRVCGGGYSVTRTINRSRV